MIRWGLLSTAAIGSVVIDANRDSARTRFVAVASRDAARSQAYAAKHDLPLAFGSYQELLDSPEVDAALRNNEGDVYRLEFDAVGEAIETGSRLPYGRDDAVAQARVLSALARSAATGLPVEPNC